MDKEYSLILEEELRKASSRLERRAVFEELCKLYSLDLHDVSVKWARARRSRNPREDGAAAFSTAFILLAQGLDSLDFESRTLYYYFRGRIWAELAHLKTRRFKDAMRKAQLSGRDWLEGDSPDPERMITQNEEVRLLRQAMDKLTESDRNLLEADLEEVTLRELSDRMKTSERLLVRRLQRARERLRASYIAEVEGLRFTRSLKGAVASADGASPIISNIIQECNRQLMHWLAAHPEDLLKVHPGTFERIVAELFADQGFEVEVITSWNQADGGVDIVAAKRLMSGIDVRLAIQCKRITQRKRVSAEPIRALSAVLEKFRAHAGVLAITSYFSRDALEESRKYFWRIALRDYDRIVKDLKDFCVFKKHPSGLWIPGYDPFGV